MATVYLRAELTAGAEVREKICVPVGKSLSSLRSGINELNLNMSLLLTELLQRDNDGCGDCATGEDDEQSDDEDEAEPRARGPPSKKRKP